ncbi:hypothetical protein [Terrabacter terrigena]|uniref:Uncharacterized protein n=1 Tax=Terrabacter terrigena TaxID=574718 RepID=A0ABW3MTT6_9MICO
MSISTSPATGIVSVRIDILVLPSRAPLPDDLAHGVRALHP